MMRNGADTLLIVPYGIETNVRPKGTHSHFLLIVPYGIETPSIRRAGTRHTNF